MWLQSSQLISSVVVPCAWSANTKPGRLSKKLRIRTDILMLKNFIVPGRVVIFFMLSSLNNIKAH